MLDVRFLLYFVASWTAISVATSIVVGRTLRAGSDAAASALAATHRD